MIWDQEEGARMRNNLHDREDAVELINQEKYFLRKAFDQKVFIRKRYHRSTVLKASQSSPETPSLVSSVP